MTWSLESGSLATARRQHGACGLKAAALVFGGENSTFDYLVGTEAYNGTVWSAGGDMAQNVAQCAGFGLQDAAVRTGGTEGTGYSKVATTEEYNGTVWSSGGSISLARSHLHGCGTLGAGLVCAGLTAAAQDVSEEYNGTVWTTGNTMVLTRASHAVLGLQTAALAVGGGWGSAAGTDVAEYNGTTWFGGISLLANRYHHGAVGTVINAIAFGGNDYSDQTVTSETFNGIVWLTAGDMVSTARDYLSEAGTAQALAIGGSTSGGTADVVGVVESYYVVAPSPGNHRGIAGIDGGVLFDGKTIIGDRANGKLYALDMNTYTDNGEEIARIRRTQIINKQRLQVVHNEVIIEFEHGVGLDVGSGVDGEDPQAQLRWSDDGGNNWSDYLSVDIGVYQQYDVRAVWRQLGRSRNRIYELKITDPVKVVLIGVSARLTPARA